MAIPCKSFTDFLSRKSEHLDDMIIKSMHPVDTWIGHVGTGRFKAEDGVEHTFDRFENVWPDLRGAWEDVTAASCVGSPCDPSETKIGMGFTRDSYKLQRKAYTTDLFCFDQILSADRAKQQFAHVVRTLRRASSLITSHRFRTEAARIAKYRWAAANNTLSPITMTWDTTMTFLTVSRLPTSKITARHLQRRVEPQIREGALGEDINRGAQPMLEFVTNMEEVWNMVEGNSELSDHWRFQQWENASQYHRYGWVGKLGNYGLRADWNPLRFNVYSGPSATGAYVLQLVHPYTNVAATEGIKEEVNADFDNAPIQLNFIWHRKAMTSLVRDTTAINPEMPFAMRDFAGKWQFVMDNLTCGTQTGTTYPIAVDNARRNKGKFIADFAFATQAEYPELAEAFLSLREPACIVDVPNCSSLPYPYPQNYSSANDLCTSTTSTLTFTPALRTETNTYVLPASSVLCNGMPIAHAAISAASIDALVLDLNAKLSAMGTWAKASATTITLVTEVCTDVNLPWTV